MHGLASDIEDQNKNKLRKTKVFYAEFSDINLRVKGADRPLLPERTESYACGLFHLMV
jgi:hypothetical protein